MPAELLGFSHLSLSCRDVDTSRDWWCGTLGFEVLEYFDEPAYREVILVHPRGIIVGFQQHRANRGERFDETRTGIDHIAFRVAHRADLDDWAARLDELGWPYSPIADREYGSVLHLRDPDGIQVEIFWRDRHPEPTRLVDLGDLAIGQPRG